MARKIMAALALVALLSTAACNSTMGPAADQNDSSIGRGVARPPAAADMGKVDYVPDPGDGGGSGERDFTRNGHLGNRNRGPIHGDMDGNDGGGGENGSGVKDDPIRRRGIVVGQPD